METLRKLALVFFVSFFLNLVWENIHYLLYAHYKGGIITEAILLHATVVDAFLITSVVGLFMLFPTLYARTYLMVLVWIAIAVGIELWALSTGRWAYNELMPLIPLLSVGLSPTVQLAITGYVAWLFVTKAR